MATQNISASLRSDLPSVKADDTPMHKDLSNPRITLGNNTETHVKVPFTPEKISAQNIQNGYQATASQTVSEDSSDPKNDPPKTQKTKGLYAADVNYKKSLRKQVEAENKIIYSLAYKMKIQGLYNSMQELNKLPLDVKRKTIRPSAKL